LNFGFKAVGHWSFMTYFVLSLVLSLILTLLVRKFALHYRIVDSPNEERKLHARPVPLLGGFAIFAAFWLVLGYAVFFGGLRWENISPTQFVGVFFGSLALMVMGVADDLRDLPPRFRLAVSSLAALAVVLGGVSLKEITNPLGGVVSFDLFDIAFFGKTAFNLLGAVVIFFWLMGMMYTTKILDGLDGLSTGIVSIGALMIFFLASTKQFGQPDIRAVALILVGACLGFLVFNFYPAKIFLGEGGSLFLGFILGVLAVIAGGKIATALLVMGIPILDLIRVAIARIRRKQPIFQGDREHLHFRLLDFGVHHRLAVLAIYAVAFIFGVTTLFLQSKQKLFMLGILALAMIGVQIWVEMKKPRHETS